MTNKTDRIITNIMIQYARALITKEERDMMKIDAIKSNVSLANWIIQALHEKLGRSKNTNADNMVSLKNDTEQQK